jgi:hypothetical protein
MRIARFAPHLHGNTNHVNATGAQNDNGVCPKLRNFREQRGLSPCVLQAGSPHRLRYPARRP